MIEQFKVLNAMLVLGEFTVRDLARYSEVKAATVYTTLNRERHYLEQLGKHETKKRGGQWLRWRVKPEQLDDLKARLSNLFVDLKATPNALDGPDSAPEVPTALLIAEDLLLKSYPAADTPEKRRELLELAEINFSAARSECENLNSCDNFTANVEAIQMQVRSVEWLLHKHTPQEVVQTHIHFCAGLIALSEMEYDLSRNRDPKPGVSVEEVHTQLTASCSLLWELGGDNCQVAFNTMQRVANSPLISRALRY